MSRSAWTTLSISGRRTFRATIRPSGRTARWTCEIDAEATGVGSIDAKTSDGGRPYSSLRIVSTWSNANGRTSSRKPGQLVGVGLGEQVGPGAQELAQLHERRPEVLADQPEPARPVLGRDVVPQRDPLDRPHQPLEVERRDHVLIAVPHQGRQDLPVARQVAEMADRFSNHATTPFSGDGARDRPQPRPDRSRQRPSGSRCRSRLDPGSRSRNSPSRIFVLHASRRFG